MKNLNDLLSETKTKEERFDELIALVPEILSGDKVYYSEDKYIYYDGENLYSGMDKYPKDGMVVGCFPYIFFLSSLYTAKFFAEKYNEIEELRMDKNFKLNEFGLVTIKDFGIVSDSIFVKHTVAKYEENILLMKKEA